MEWQLRDATDEDRDFIFDLHRAALGPYIEETWGWDETWQRQHFENVFARAGWGVLTVGDGERAGAVRISETEREVYLEDIEILPAFQGKGLGTSVILSIVHQASTAQKGVALQVLKVNPAMQLYKRLGFTIVGEDDAHFQMRRVPDLTG